jgi:colanic acid biosynthesis glycosyl transferase WcaI
MVSGRLVILTQWFPPEQAPFGQMMFELATDLSSRGWEVTVITGFPNHPGGRVFPGYRKRLLRRERAGKVRVWRVWLSTSPRRTLLNRLLTFVSFTLSSAGALLACERPHVIFAVLQPLSVGAILPVIALLRRSRLVFNVQDLHPDAQIRLGLVRNPALIRLLRALESHAYRACDRLTVICDAFRARVIERGAPAEKVEVIENWIDTDEIAPGARDNDFRRAAGCRPEDFVVLWAGTLGHVAGAEILVAAAERLSANREVQFVIVGEGPELPTLQQTAASRGLANVHFMPFQPRDRLAEVQSSADVSVVTLARDFGEVSVPSKVLGYMAAGRPLVAAVPEESATAAIVRASGCGRVVPVGDAAALAQAIRAYAAEPQQALQDGRRGREYVLAHGSRARATMTYAALFARVQRS